jgi:hypothetical protein
MRVRPPEVFEGELPHERLGAPHLLVDLDGPARAHDAQPGVSAPDPRLGLGRIGLHDQDGMARPDVRLGRAPEGVAQIGRERVPVLERVGGEERELARAARSGVAVDGDACAVRPAVVHLSQHRGQVRTERVLDLRRFREEPDDPAHMSEIYMWKAAWKLVIPTKLAVLVWRFPP